MTDTPKVLRLPPLMSQAEIDAQRVGAYAMMARRVTSAGHALMRIGCALMMIPIVVVFGGLAIAIIAAML